MSQHVVSAESLSLLHYKPLSVIYLLSIMVHGGVRLSHGPNKYTF